MKKYLIPIFILLFASTAMAATDVSFRWDANTESDLAGYRLYRGTLSGGPYTMVDIEIAAQDTTCTDTSVSDGAYFWVLTAFDTEGLESGYSVEATDILDSTPPNPPQGFTIWQKIIAWLRSIFSHGFRMAG